MIDTFKFMNDNGNVIWREMGTDVNVMEESDGAIITHCSSGDAHCRNENRFEVNEWHNSGGRGITKQDILNAWRE